MSRQESQISPAELNERIWQSRRSHAFGSVSLPDGRIAIDFEFLCEADRDRQEAQVRQGDRALDAALRSSLGSTIRATLPNFGTRFERTEREYEGTSLDTMRPSE